MTWAFLGSALLVIVTPGPDLALLTGILLRTGRRAPAFGAAAGMLLAGVGYSALAIAGAGRLLAESPGLLVGLRLGGAGLLAGYSVLALTGATRGRGHAAGPEPSSRPAFAIGFANTAGNPKVGLFLLAFLPQFVPAARDATRALTLLATAYLALVALWLGCYVVLAHRLARLLSGVRAERILQAVTGFVLLGLAVRLWLS